jgi:hypothetical protein
VYIALEARGTGLGKNVKSRRNILGAGPRDGEERNHE